MVGPQITGPVGPLLYDFEQHPPRAFERCQLSVAVQSVGFGQLIFLQSDRNQLLGSAQLCHGWFNIGKCANERYANTVDIES